MRKAGSLSIHGQRYFFLSLLLLGIRPAFSSGVLWPAFGNTLSPKLSRPLKILKFCLSLKLQPDPLQ